MPKTYRASSSPPPSIDPDALEKAKQKSTAQLLFRCARRVNELALERVSARAKVQLRPSHTALFPHIDLGGTRQTELARRVGVSKQAIHQLVGELVEAGVLERAIDPSDARAQLVRFSARKGRSLLDGLALLGELEKELAAAIGKKKMKALHEALVALDEHLETSK